MMRSACSFIRCIPPFILPSSSPASFIKRFTCPASFRLHKHFFDAISLSSFLTLSAVKRVSLLYLDFQFLHAEAVGGGSITVFCIWV